MSVGVASTVTPLLQGGNQCAGGFACSVTLPVVHGHAPGDGRGHAAVDTTTTTGRNKSEWRGTANTLVFSSAPNAPPLVVVATGRNKRAAKRAAVLEACRRLDAPGALRVCKRHCRGHKCEWAGQFNNISDAGLGGTTNTVFADEAIQLGQRQRRRRRRRRQQRQCGLRHGQQPGQRDEHDQFEHRQRPWHTSGMHPRSCEVGGEVNAPAPRMSLCAPRRNGVLCGKATTGAMLQQESPAAGGCYTYTASTRSARRATVPTAMLQVAAAARARCHGDAVANAVATAPPVDAGVKARLRAMFRSDLRG